MQQQHQLKLLRLDISLCTTLAVREMLQKPRVLIPEALHFTAAVRALGYHSYLAAHRIALSRISLAEQEERERRSPGRCHGVWRQSSTTLTGRVRSFIIAIGKRPQRQARHVSYW